MKKNILSAILMLFAVSAMAATEEIDNAYRWYLQGHVTAGYNGNEDMRYTSFGKGIGLGGDLSLGYNINDFWGVSLELGYYGNKGAYLAGPYGNDEFDNFKFSSVEPTFNVNYNLTNGMLGYKPSRRNALYFHAGLGAAFSFSNDAPDNCQGNTDYKVKNGNQTVLKGSLGFNWVYMFNNFVAFTADATAHILGDKHNGADWQVPVDGRFNLGVGLRFFVSKSKKPAREVIYVDEINTVVDTITVVEQVKVDQQDVYPIFFDVNANELQASQKDIVKTVADQLRQNPSKIVYVLGYADKTSEDADNAQLAKNRADAITAELINLGINKDRIVAHDMGDNVQPFLNLTSKNRSTICIITDLKH